MPLSKSSSLLVISTVFATILTSFGINALLRPEIALSFFELYPSTSKLAISPAVSHEAILIRAVMIVYGARDIFMGVVMYAAAYYKERRVLGVSLLAGGAVAFVDGAVCKWIVGQGEWGHWSYAPVMGFVGCLLLGISD